MTDSVAIDAKRILLRYGAPIAILDKVSESHRIEFAREIAKTTLPDREMRLRHLLAERGYAGPETLLPRGRRRKSKAGPSPQAVPAAAAPSPDAKPEAAARGEGTLKAKPRQKPKASPKAKAKPARKGNAKTKPPRKAKAKPARKRKAKTKPRKTEASRGSRRGKRGKKPGAAKRKAAPKKKK